MILLLFLRSVKLFPLGVGRGLDSFDVLVLFSLVARGGTFLSLEEVFLIPGRIPLEPTRVPGSCMLEDE